MLISARKIKKYAYSYHYQKLDDMIFRYDNAPHHPEIATFPYHKHLSSNEVIESPEADLKSTLEEIIQILK